MGLSATRLASLAQAGGGRTPTQRAIAVLRKFGTDAHIYLPGVGMLNGLQAGNYIDSAGTQAGEVNQPVGLVLDATGGIPATQPTTRKKPILRQVGGRYSWEFDGINDTIQLDSRFAELSDDLAIVAGVSSNDYRRKQHVISTRNGTPQFGLTVGSTGVLFAGYVDDAGVNGTCESAEGAVSGANITFVLSTSKTGDVKRLRKDGVIVATNSTPLGVATFASAKTFIGSENASGLRFLDGNIYPVIAIKGTVSDADLLLLEKWVGSMSGVTI